MIRFNTAGAAALAFLIALSVCRGESEMAVPRFEVEQLVGRDHGYLSEEEYSAWQQEVASRPDIKPDLLALLRRAYNADKGLDVGMALAALQLRTDLTEAELKEILMPLVSRRDAAALDRLHRSYAYAGLQVLKNYPSKEHEDLAIAYLSRAELEARLGAAQALAQIGTERSLAQMRAYAEELKPPEGLPMTSTKSYRGQSHPSKSDCRNPLQERLLPRRM